MGFPNNEGLNYKIIIKGICQIRQINKGHVKIKDMVNKGELSFVIK